MNKLLFISIVVLFSFLKSTEMQSVEWKVVYEPDINEYIGLKEMWPQLPGNFKNLKIEVSYQNEYYYGSMINDSGDGSYRPMSTDSAKKYFEEFKKIFQNQLKGTACTKD